MMTTMTRQSFRVDFDDGFLGGWVQGTGLPVLLLHGGPGLSYEYMESLAPELGEGYSVASYQQRGLAPSSEQGPFTVADNVSDVGRVLDGLGWDVAVLVGHSWGGHLALHVAAAIPARVSAVLAVDPFGAVGDGGEQQFEAEMNARTPADVRQRAIELDERAMRGEGSEEDAIESFRLVWPAYFPSRESAPPMPAIRMSVACYSETFESLHEELPRLDSALPSIQVPVGFVAGEASPMPNSSSTDAAHRIANAWVETVPEAGHFPWLDIPGCVRSGFNRLLLADTVRPRTVDASSHDRAGGELQ
jgi:pimeloyl-ACP methyl ester carboxylesterase